MSTEQAKAEVGELKRLFRDMFLTITLGLDGKRTPADCVAHLKLMARNSKLYQFNSAPAQPMRELIRSIDDKQKLMHIVMSPEFWLLSFRQEALLAQAESERLLDRYLEAA